jgi:FAD/FMN-containing dehydrogenase
MSAPTTTQIPGFRGDLIAPGHHHYDDARAVWNGTVDRRPRLIARCSGTADVAAAVRFARARDLEIAARGGGHNVAGTAEVRRARAAGDYHRFASDLVWQLGAELVTACGIRAGDRVLDVAAGSGNTALRAAATVDG